MKKRGIGRKEEFGRVRGKGPEPVLARGLAASETMMPTGITLPPQTRVPGGYQSPEDPPGAELDLTAVSGSSL